MFKVILRWLARIALVAVVLFLGFAIYIMRLNFNRSDAKSTRYFAQKGVAALNRSIPYAEGTLRWVETAKPQLPLDAPLVVFVHGAPGSAADFQPYQADSSILQQARTISVDRLGYGSNYGKAESSIAEHARAVKAAVDQYPAASEIILVGHSYGGPIVAKYGMDYPERVKKIIMLAPVNDPANEPIFWYSYFAKWKATRWMLSKGWRVSGEEKFSHAAALQAIESGWPGLQVPISHYHGDKDDLAPPRANMDFSKKMIPANMLELQRLPEAGHLIPFMNFDLTRNAILAALRPKS